MEMEFNDCFEDLFDSALRRLRNAWIIKLEAIKECNQIKREFEEMKLKKVKSLKKIEMSGSE